QMKSFLPAVAMLAITALGVGQSVAQTGTVSPGSIGPTSPLGANFGETSGKSESSAQTDNSNLGIGATSPLGADFGQTPGNNSQITPAPFTNPAPCASGGSGALGAFDGGGLSPTNGGLSPTTGFTTSGIGAESTMSTPCNSVSSSGVMSAPNSAATTARSANSSSSASSASSSFGSPTTATASSSPNTASLGVTALGTSGLGTTGLGTTGLGSHPTKSSTLQTSTSPSTAVQSETSCSGNLGTPPASTVTAQSLSGGVPDPAQSLGGSGTDAAQSLGGTARVPVTPVPCPTTSTMP